MNDSIRAEDIKDAGLEGKWVRATTPATPNFLGRDTFNDYGRLVRVTDEYLILFSKRMGLIKIPIQNILNIGVAKKPEGEV